MHSVHILQNTMHMLVSYFCCPQQWTLALSCTSYTLLPKASLTYLVGKCLVHMMRKTPFTCVGPFISDEVYISFFISFLHLPATVVDRGCAVLLGHGTTLNSALNKSCIIIIILVDTREYISLHLCA